MYSEVSNHQLHCTLNLVVMIVNNSLCSLRSCFSLCTLGIKICPTEIFIGKELRRDQCSINIYGSSLFFTESQETLNSECGLVCDISIFESTESYLKEQFQVVFILSRLNLFDLLRACSCSKTQRPYYTSVIKSMHDSLRIDTRLYVIFIYFPACTNWMQKHKHSTFLPSSTKI